MKHANVAFFIPHIGCPNKCSFCDQKTISGKQNIPSVEEIKSSVSSALNKLPSDILKKSEIAFFGGSFTAIDRDLMISFLESVQEYIGEDKFMGIRISTRPDSINEEVLEILKKYKVSSIELGAQSMIDDVLEKNMRGHTANDVIKSSELIKKFGFSLGLQMMTGLYGDSLDGAIHTANQFVKLQPDTVRIYPTVVLRNTYLEKLYLDGVYKPLNVNETVSLCAKILDIFELNCINVIRVGLHDGSNIKENFVAGAYHPALGELIMGEQMFLKALDLISAKKHAKNDFTFEVNPAYVSQVIGQNKRNIERFSELGYRVKIKSNKSLKEKEIKLI